MELSRAKALEAIRRTPRDWYRVPVCCLYRIYSPGMVSHNSGNTVGDNSAGIFMEAPFK